MDETTGQAILQELREIKALLAQASGEELRAAALRVLISSGQAELHDLLQSLSRVARPEPPGDFGKPFESPDALRRQERRLAAVKRLKALLEDEPYTPVTVIFQPDDGPARTYKLNPPPLETS
ncbi:MAG: hypothetical protein L6R45_29585 [Anaerolineae bacterium]|nr:hypothetical protein [Anaerolineae bacterium]